MSNLYFLLAVLACALPSAALLWLGAGLADKARSDSGESHVALRAIALGLATMALWWPLQQGLIARATETGSGAWLLLTAVLAMSALVLLAAATVGGSDDWVSARRLASGGEIGRAHV